MKKTLTYLSIALTTLLLVACTPKAENKTTAKSSSSTAKSKPSTSSSSSSEEINLPSATNTNITDGTSGLYESPEHIEQVLSQIKGVDQITAWQNFKQIQLGTGFSITSTDESGNTSEMTLGNSDITPSTYQDVVNLLGEPSMSVEEGGIAIWQTEASTITVFFTGDIASNKSFQGFPDAKTIQGSSVSAISEGMRPEEVIERLGQPLSAVQTARSTALVRVDDQLRNNTVMFSKGVVHSTLSGDDAERLSALYKD